MRLLFKAKGHYFLCLIILINFILSCKEPDNVGLTVLPKSDLSSVNFSDTASLETSVVREDSVPATGISANLLGAIHDNLFGDTKSNFYSQLLLSTISVSFGSNPVCDSIILTLAYSGYYGDTTSVHNFEVYKMEESIADSVTYYSNKTFSVSDQLGTLTTSDIRPTDSIGGKSPHLRIPLNNSLAATFFNAPSDVYASNSAFTAFFKGIYVKDNTSLASGGSILYLNPNSKDTLSKITLYYNSGSSYVFLFPSAAGVGRVNHFEHDYSSAVFANHFNDPVFGDSLCYVQSMAGIKTRIDFPFLSNLTQNGNISINKAELVITIDNTSTATYPAHSNLFLVGIDASGSSFFLPDVISSPLSFGGGQANGAYSFLITRYIQQILSGSRQDYGLYLVASGAAVNASRTVVGGSNNSSIRMKLNLNYTNINP
ncbi:MAG: DUF4270 domain-containing protein [Bacteroidia bacterium]